MSVPFVNPTPEQMALYGDLIPVLRKHRRSISPVEMVAALSCLLGQTMAMVDLESITVEAVLDVVSANIKQGSAYIMSEQMGEAEGSA